MTREPNSMIDRLADALFSYTNSRPGGSPFSTPIEGLMVLRSDHPKPPNHMISQPAICIVAQGAKWASFGGDRLEYRAGQALVIGVEAPSVGRVVEADPGKPCLVLAFGLDLQIMREVAEALDAPPTASGEPVRGFFVTDIEGPLGDCALRLVRLLDTPEAVPTLYPGLMREICYWLLASPRGGDIARLVLKSSPSQFVIQAMHVLRRRFRETLRVEELAAVARMSPSAFHRQFKALTSLTPLQHQKQLRLLEARRLMISCGFNAEAAAFEVGYESASQFSREYGRMFGAPPKRDLKQLQSILWSDGDASDAPRESLPSSGRPSEYRGANSHNRARVGPQPAR